MKYCVYTAITGGYEKPKTDQNWGNADWIFFGDKKAGGRWKFRKASSVFCDPRLNARFHKIIPEFENYDFYIWIDGSISLKVTPETLIANIGGADMLVHKHPTRDCVYDEAKEVLRLKLDYPEAVAKQVKRLEEFGYRKHNGLAETKVVVRRNCKAIDKFNEEWFHQLLTGSSRDQLSFNPAATMCQIAFKTMNLSPLFEQTKHERKAYS